MTTRAECLATAEGVAGRAWAETSALAAEGGLEAVAVAAWEPGGPDQSVIAAQYRRMQDEERTRRGRGREAGAA